MSCPYFGRCGGCYYPVGEITKQLTEKFQQFVKEINPSAPAEKILAPLPSVNNFYYRNKMEFAFGQSDDGRILLGLRRRKKFSEIIDLNDCLLFGPGLQPLLNLWRGFARENKFLPYNLKNHRGFLRYLVVRKSFSTNQWLNILITTTPQNSEVREVQQKLEQIFKKIKNELPAVSGLVWLTNDELSDSATGKILAAWGNDFLIEKILKKDFIIRPLTFFQANPQTAELLLKTIDNWVKNISYRQYALDLYCGVGLISLFLTDYFSQVWGVELNPQSIQTAIENARKNNQKNIGFFATDALEYLKKCGNKLDLITVDPPRAGLGKKISEQLLKNKAPTIIYVSCNPKTLALDLKILLQQYRIQKIQPIDFFPYTPHLESVSLLTL